MSNDINIQIAVIDTGAAKAIDNAANQIQKLAERAQDSAGRITRLRSGLSGFAKVAGLFSAGAAASGNALFSLSSSAAATGAAIDKQAQALGLSAEAFQELGFAIGEVSGMSEGQFANAIGQLNTRMSQAGEGSAAMIAAFDQIGISQEAIRSGAVTTESAFNTLLGALQGAESPADAMALASQFFGEEAAKLGPILMEAGGEVDGLRQKARDLGIVMSSDGVQASAEFTDKLNEVSRQFKAAKDAIGLAFLPVLTDTFLPAIQDKVIPAMQTFADMIGGLIQSFQDLPGPVQEAAELVATAMGAGGPMLLAVSAASKAFAGLLGLGPIGLFVGIAAVAVAAWVQWGEEIKEAIGGAIEFITEKFNAFLEFVQSIPERFMQIGRDIIDGLKAGINEKWEELKERLAELTDFLPQIMRDRLESNSPSKVFMRIGNDIGSGLAQGITQAAGLVLGSLSSVAGKSESETENSVGTILSSLQTLFQGSKALAIAQALINTWEGATKALSLPFPANIAAFAATLVTGMRAVTSIRSTTPGPGASAAIAASTPAPAAQAVAAAPASNQPPPQQVSINLGDQEFFSRAQVESLADALREFGADGGVLVS